MHLIKNIILSFGVRTATKLNIFDIFGAQPLCNNKDVHPSEESEQQQELRDKLEEEIKFVAEMQAIHTL